MSRVIKSNDTGSPSGLRKRIQLSSAVFEKPESYESGHDPVPILQRAEIEAKTLRKQAREEADRLLSEIEQKRKQAEAEIKKAFEDAEKRGYSEGYQFGVNEGRKQYGSRIEEARSIIDSAKEASRDRLEEAELDILALAVEIAKKIIGSVLPNDNERWLEMVTKAISDVKEHQEIRLIVHHKWYDFLMNHKKELEALLKNAAELYIYPETTVDEYACILEFPYGRVDAGVDTQLIEIKRKLSAKLEEAAHGRNSLIERD